MCEPRAVERVRLVRLDANSDIAELERRCNEAIAEGFDMPTMIGTVRPGEVVVLLKWAPWEDEGPCDEDVGVLRPL